MIVVVLVVLLWEGWCRYVHRKKYRQELERRRNRLARQIFGMRSWQMLVARGVYDITEAKRKLKSALNPTESLRELGIGEDDFRQIERNGSVGLCEKIIGLMSAYSDFPPDSFPDDELTEFYDLRTHGGVCEKSFMELKNLLIQRLYSMEMSIEDFGITPEQLLLWENQWGVYGVFSRRI